MPSESTTAMEATIKEYILNEFLPGEDPAALTDTTPLVTSGIFDSISTMKLVSFLEERFKISIAPSEAKPTNMNTVAQIVNLVRAKRP
jgi:acyl carrier protein